MSFIDQLIEEIKTLPVKDYNRLQVIFPTRRACVIFKYKFIKHFDKTTWLPSVCSIEDFILNQSEYTLADDAVLILELFEVFKELFPEMTFDEFYSWGNVLLNDFDEMDSNLVDHRKLFATFQNIADIDEQFDYDEEQKSWMKDFWNSLFGTDSDNENDIRQQFKNNWQHIPFIYESFRKRLLDKKLTYRGLTYRLISTEKEKIDDGNFDHFVFAGLYALSKSEERIIDDLLLKRKASLYWDTDSYYIKNTLHEAGEYIRNNFLITDKYKWNSNYFETGTKKITVYKAVQNIAQAKQVGVLIDELISQQKFDAASTAIVLADEQMLLPVLNSLPASLTDVNITMGYPVKQTSLFSFIKFYIDLIQSQKQSGKHTLFSKFYFRQWMHHAFVRNYFEKLFDDFEEAVENMFAGYVSIQTLQKNYHNELFDLLASSRNDVLKNIRCMLECVVEINHGSLNRIEQEACKFFIKTIDQLKAVTEIYKSENDKSFELTVLKDMIKNLRIPFSGEPVKGLQIMGFLETRLLDFDTIFILSVNEGFLPAQKSNKTYIPYSLRKAFGLQTHEHQDSISAYHFYRLMQRASKINLFYNAHPGKTGGGEPSRFLMQMDYELKSYPDISITHKPVYIPVVTHPEKEISIEKKGDVEKLLLNLLKTDDENSFAFSPTSLLTYLTCKLKFYFRYIAKIKETESFDDKIEGALFGLILHTTMELLYKDKIEIKADVIDKLLKIAEEKTIEAMHLKFPQSQNGLEGKNILMKNILVELVKRILNHDKKLTPFKIENVELVVEADLLLDKTGKVKIKGTIDRLESAHDYLRIVDYKTGKTKKISERKDLMTQLFSDVEHKETFQLFVYGLLLSKKFADKKIKAAYYALKQLNNGMIELNETGFSESELGTFEQSLKATLAELFDISIPFSQTEDAARCTYCPYINICNR